MFNNFKKVICRSCEKTMDYDPCSNKFVCMACGSRLDKPAIEAFERGERLINEMKNERRWKMPETRVAWNNWCSCTYTSCNDPSTDTITSYTATGTVWRNWNNYGTDSSTYTTSGSSTHTVVWRTWCEAGTISCQGTDGVWYVWNDQHGFNDEPIACGGYGSCQETEEQRADRLRRAEEARLEEEKRRKEAEKRAEDLRKKKEAAESKAKELLLDLIGEKELKIYEETGRLYVRGKKYDYIVPKDGFIKQIKKDKIVDLCVHLEDRSSVPPTDNVIAMKLHIEEEEDMVLQLANNHGERERPKELPKAACM